MARKVSTAVPSGLVQIIHLRWDKLARGGQGACQRNSVPQSLAIPAANLKSSAGQLYIDESYWNEQNDFAEPYSVRRYDNALAEGFNFACVTVATHTEGLAVRFRYDPHNGGLPDRSFLNHAPGDFYAGRVLLVRPSQWVRLHYNGRFSNDYYWWFEQTTVNVAWFAHEPDGNVFLDREPSQELVSLADLW
jgi:hypothetical protein